MIFKETRREVVYDYSDDIIENVWILRSLGLDSSQQIEETEGEGVWTTGNKGVFRNVLVSAIGKAREVVCISSFLIGEEKIEQALMDAVDDGVRVYILSVPATLLDREEAITDEEERVDERIEECKAFLDRIAEKMLLRAASHFHSKFLLVDPKDSMHAEGYLSTANFNKALTEGVEIGVQLTPLELQGVYQQFVRGFWVESSQELRRKGSLTPVSSHLKDIKIPSRIEEVLTTISSSSSDFKILTLKERILEFLEQTKGPVYLSMYGFDEGHEIVKEITKLARERKVTVLTRPRPRMIPVHCKLAEAGIIILGHKNLHAKAIVSKINGETVALVMTANLQSRGIDEGFDTGVLLRGRRAQRVEEILIKWAEEFPLIFKTKVKLGELKGSIWIGNRNIFTEATVEEELSIAGDVITVQSLEIDPTEKIPKRRKRNKNEFYHRVKVIYHLRPPLVPAGAKQIRDDTSPLPLYKSREKTFIAVKNEKELQTAIQLKKQRYPNALIVVEGK